jgi:EpsI family protein
MEAVWQNKFVRILTIVLLAQAVLFYTASRGDSRPLQRPLKEFPKNLPGWQAVEDAVIDQPTLDVLKADDVLDRFYVRTPVPDTSQMTPTMKAALVGRSYDLFLEYFSTQQQGQSPHSPKNCLPGAGWQPSTTGQVTVPIPGLATPITINQYVVTRGEAHSVVLYWYQSHGRVVANEFAAKFYLVADSMRYRRSDTAMIRVVAPVYGDDVDGAVKNATDLVKAAFPSILTYFPM